MGLKNFILGACLIGGLVVVFSDKKEAPTEEPITTNTEPATAAENTIVVDVDSQSDCSNYLRGRSYTSNNARLSFSYDGYVSLYTLSGELVFGGTLHVGSKYGQVSRYIYARDMTNSSQLEFILSGDGKILDTESFILFWPA
jgi:hypothetical protein